MVTTNSLNTNPSSRHIINFSAYYKAVDIKQSSIFYLLHYLDLVHAYILIPQHLSLPKNISSDSPNPYSFHQMFCYRLLIWPCPLCCFHLLSVCLYSEKSFQFCLVRYSVLLLCCIGLVLYCSTLLLYNTWYCTVLTLSVLIPVLVLYCTRTSRSTMCFTQHSHVICWLRVQVQVQYSTCTCTSTSLQVSLSSVGCGGEEV